MFYVVLWALAVGVEIVALLACIVVLPPSAITSPGERRRRSLISGALLISWIFVFHGKEVVAQVLIALEPMPAHSVASNDRYCTDFDLVEPGLTPVNYENEPDALEGRVWRFGPPFSFVDTSMDCGSRCAAWLESGLPRRLFVGAWDNYRIPYNGADEDLLPLRAVRIAHTPECAASIGAWVRAWRIPDYLDRRIAPSTSDRDVAWDESCFAFERTTPMAPLLLTNIAIQQRDLGFGLTRVDLTTTLVEHFSDEVLADSHMVMIRGASPTVQPFDDDQHVHKGSLLSSYELHARYRAENCAANDGGTR